MRSATCFAFAVAVPMALGAQTREAAAYHDPSVKNQGENLWMGTAGAFTLAEMVDDWGRERRHFANGIFPEVSTTGSWSDVGHYTQMVWRNTTAVGCAGRAASDGYYRLVCRYSPAGNIIGQRAF